MLRWAACGHRVDRSFRRRLARIEQEFADRENRQPGHRALPGRGAACQAGEPRRLVPVRRELPQTGVTAGDEAASIAEPVAAAAAPALRHLDADRARQPSVTRAPWLSGSLTGAPSCTARTPDHSPTHEHPCRAARRFDPGAQVTLVKLRGERTGRRRRDDRPPSRRPPRECDVRLRHRSRPRYIAVGVRDRHPLDVRARGEQSEHAAPQQPLGPTAHTGCADRSTSPRPRRPRVGRRTSMASRSGRTRRPAPRRRWTDAAPVSHTAVRRRRVRRRRLDCRSQAEAAVQRTTAAAVVWLPSRMEAELPARPVSATRRVRLQGLYASRDVVAGRPALFGRTAESVVTYWPGGIRAGVEVALAPCPRIRVR